MPLLEEWKSIPDFPDYEASSLGRIRRASCNYILKLSTHSEGYLIVTLMNRGKRHVETVHRIVCKTFHASTYFEGAHALHKNHNKTDCSRDNLYWGTHQDNIQDNIRDGQLCRGSQVGTSKLTELQVLEIRARVAAGASGRSLAKEYGVKQPTISDIIRRRQWKHI